MDVGNDSVPCRSSSKAKTKQKEKKNFGEIYQYSVKEHTDTLCRQIYLELSRLGHVASFLKETSKKFLACSFLLSRLKLISALFLLINLPYEPLKMLQRCQNNPSRLIMYVKNVDHMVVSIVRHLHCLSVRSKTELKAALFFNRFINKITPVYLSNMFLSTISTGSLFEQYKSFTREKITQNTGRCFSAAEISCVSV